MGSAVHLGRRGFLAGVAAGVALPAVARAGVAQERQAAAWQRMELLDPAGRRFTVGELGAKLVLVHLWAHWCPPCLGELAPLQRLADRMGGDGLAVLMISDGRFWAADRAYAARAGLRLSLATPHPDMPDSLTNVAFGAEGGGFRLPQSLLMAPARRQLLGAQGATDWTDAAQIGRIRAGLTVS